MQHIPRYVTVHHSGTTFEAGINAVEQIRRLQLYLQRERNWPDLPYHFLIAPNGRIFEGRNPKYAGATMTRYDPRGHLLIGLWGNFDVESVQEKQLRSAVALTAWLCWRYAIPPSQVGGHRDRSTDTSCPGTNLYRFIAGGQFELWVEETLQGNTPIVRVGSGPEARSTSPRSDHVYDNRRFAPVCFERGERHRFDRGDSTPASRRRLEPGS